MKNITVITELRKEFSEIIERFGKSISRFFMKHPKPIFFTMVILLLSSVLLCFTLLRTEEKKANLEKRAFQKVEGSLSEIGTTVSRLQKTLEIREALKALLGKDSLSSKDSLLMIRMIRELEQTGQRKK